MQLHVQAGIANRRRNLTLLTWILGSVVFLGGAWNCWNSCYAPDPDAIHYLNIGEAVERGDVPGFLNSTWGPLFGVISALWLRILPNAQTVYPREALKILNLCILAIVLVAAAKLCARLVEGKDRSFETCAATKFFVFGALWVALQLMGVFRESPDLMLLAVALASTFCYLRLFDAGGERWYVAAVLIGFWGAAGYYLKQSYFPIALLFLAALAWPPGTIPKRILRVAAGTAVFIALTVPWMLGLSARDGHLTWGGNSKLNYILSVEHHGDLYGPLFDALPQKDRLPSDPTTVDFGADFPHAQCPLFFDPAFYLNDVPIKFDWKLQVKDSLGNYTITINLFRHKGPFVIALILIGFGLLCFRGLSLTSKWVPLILICIAPFVLYPLVHVEYRYLCPYLFLGGACAWGWFLSTRKNVSKFAAALIVAGLLIAAVWDYTRPGETSHISFGCCVNPYQRFTQELSARGVSDGSKLVLVGAPRGIHFYSWLDPGRYRLQAVITDPQRFFVSGPDVRKRIEEELADRGSRVIVAPAELVPAADAGNWQSSSIGYMFRIIGR
jgi:hypothetical protein